MLEVGLTTQWLTFDTITTKMLQISMLCFLLGSISARHVLPTDEIVVNPQNLTTTNQQNCSTLPPAPFISDSLLGKYSNAAVATDNVLCSEIARDILISGGNAVDASVAAIFCIGVVHAQSSGLGGGHFSTIYMKDTNKCIYLNAREMAPKKAHRDMYADNHDDSFIGYRAIAVPGEVHGAYTAFRNYGSGNVTWRQILQPTINMLTNGYPLSPALAEQLVQPTFRKYIWNSTNVLNVYINPATRRPYKAGDIIKQPKLAATFIKLQNADDPIEEFYSGGLSKQIIDEFENNGAIITAEDLRDYKTDEIQASTTTSIDRDRGLVACHHPLPAGTDVTISIIKTIKAMGVSPLNFTTDLDQQAQFLHNFIEAGKYAFAMRQHLADPEFNKTAIMIAKQLISDEYAQKVASKIVKSNMKTHIELSEYQKSIFENKSPQLRHTVEDHGTSHLSIVDVHGNAVALTTTINHYFGSRVGSLETGILWNDQMDDFSQPGRSNKFDFAPSEANFIEPGKRPSSSISTIIVLEKDKRKVKLVIGASGGSRIITGTSYAAIRALWGNETIKQSIDSPRVHDQLLPTVTQFENKFNPKLAPLLAAKGHNLTFLDDRYSVVQAVKVDDDGILTANSDYRKGISGQPAGY